MRTTCGMTSRTGYSCRACSQRTAAAPRRPAADAPTPYEKAKKRQLGGVKDHRGSGSEVKVRLHKKRVVSEICGNVYPCFVRDIIAVHLQCSSINLWAGQL